MNIPGKLQLATFPEAVAIAVVAVGGAVPPEALCAGGRSSAPLDVFLRSRPGSRWRRCCHGPPGVGGRGARNDRVMGRPHLGLGSFFSLLIKLGRGF